MEYYEGHHQQVETMGHHNDIPKGCFSSAGTREVFKIEGIMYRAKYQTILAQNLEAFIKEFHLSAQ